MEKIFLKFKIKSISFFYLKKVVFFFCFAFFAPHVFSMVVHDSDFNDVALWTSHSSSTHVIVNEVNTSDYSFSQVIEKLQDMKDTLTHVRVRKKIKASTFSYASYLDFFSHTILALQNIQFLDLYFKDEGLFSSLRNSLTILQAQDIGHAIGNLFHLIELRFTMPYVRSDEKPITWMLMGGTRGLMSLNASRWIKHASCNQHISLVESLARATKNLKSIRFYKLNLEEYDNQNFRSKIRGIKPYIVIGDLIENPLI